MSDILIRKGNATKWKKSFPISNVRRQQHNIISNLPGVKRDAKNAKTILDVWKLFFTDSAFDKIINYTNA